MKGFKVVKKEIEVTFMHPLTGAKLQAIVSSDLRAADIVDALIAERFIEESPEKYDNYALNYGLMLSGGGLLEPDQSLFEAGVTGGVILVTYSTVAYGCPSSNDVAGVVPECMLISFEEPIKVKY